MAKVTITYEYESEEAARAHIDILTRGATTAAPEVRTEPAEPEQQPNITATPEQRNDPAHAEDATDSEGMPFNADVHSGLDKLNEDGTWRAKRGKAEEAKKARADWKAAGGDVTPHEPEAEPEPEQQPAAAGMPGMPGMPAQKAAPVSFDSLVAKASGMLERGVIDNDSINDIYNEHLPNGDASVLYSNESLRAQLMARFLEIEPEAK